MNYVEYDNIGVKAIFCMRCGAPIVERGYVNILVNSIPPREEKVMVLKKLSSFRRRKFNVEGGAYVEAMVCSNCVDLVFDLDEMEQSIKAGWEVTWRQEGRSKKEIKQLKKQLPKLERKK
jgi:hypothetical protein